MTQLSVNINKIATLRNARGGDVPNLLQVALDCQRFGAQGITVHPRPDERHIRYSDVPELKKNISTEFNIEGYPSPTFIQLVLANLPAQVTLVPDPPEAITSNSGWDAITELSFLQETIGLFKEKGIRVSIFMDPDEMQIEAASKTGADRIELYTEAYAVGFSSDKSKAIAPYVHAAATAKRLGLGLNAGHDLNLENLAYFCENIPTLKEVSIGHALISDALYLGLESTVKAYLKAVQAK